jgi:phage-related baseplate assembly protein
MTVPTLTQLYTAKTPEEVMAVQIQVAQAVELPTTAWQSGSVGREYLEISAATASGFSETSVQAAGAGLLDWTEDDWLTLSAYQIYQVTRIDATFGTTEVVLTNVSALSYTLAAGDLILYNIDSGKTYTSTTGGTLSPGNVTPTTITISVRADEAGTDSNAASGSISGFVTPLEGVTGTNSEPLVASDAESNQALRDRCRESMAKASPNGPSDAYNYFAKTATRSLDGSAIGVTRTNLDQGNGTVTVYVADASGPIDDDDLADVSTAIQLYAVPTGFTAVVLNATGVTVDVAATVYLARSSTLTIDELNELIEEQLTAYFADAPIGGYQAGGGYIFYSAVVGQIFEAAPGQVIRVVLTSPSSDVALTASQVAVLGDITIAIAT